MVSLMTSKNPPMDIKFRNWSSIEIWWVCQGMMIFVCIGFLMYLGEFYSNHVDIGVILTSSKVIAWFLNTNDIGNTYILSNTHTLLV